MTDTTVPPSVRTHCDEQLQAWEGPVHFVWGDADLVFTWEWAEQCASLIPGATLDRIEGAGHFLQEDAAEGCVTAVLRRLR